MPFPTPRRIAEARAARRAPAPVQAIAAPDPSTIPNRSGFVAGIPPGGIDEQQGEFGKATGTDRGTLLQELWEAYLACPWAWACVNAIARTVTADGLTTDWDADTGEGEAEPEKPAEVVALERFFAFCNPDQDVKQLCRNVVADLQVFGDALLELVCIGEIPVAIYNLDVPTTYPRADEHGKVNGWKQVTEFGQEAEFEPDEVIHISLDSARPGVFGISPTHAAQTSIMTWMFVAACLKESARRGFPPNIHADHPAGTPDTEVTRWSDQYQTRNIGPQNVGTPITTKGGGKVTELQTAKITDLIAAKNQSRDEIVSDYGVPPAKVGIIEAGNLGGGTGTDQNKSYQLDLIWPISGLIAEKLQFRVAVKGFGVKGWHLRFGRTDYRDDQVIENIRDLRVRNATWTINRSRADAGEPGVEGGDVPVLVARQDVIAVSDIPAMSKATIAGKAGPARGGTPATGGLSGLASTGDSGGTAESAARLVAGFLAARKAAAAVTERGAEDDS
jgi:hypothetical protein